VLTGWQLPRDLTAQGDQLHWFDSVGSTMDEARRIASEPVTCRHWIAAGRQEMGRGRLGRIWASPLGNLSLTLLMPAPCGLAMQPQLGFVAGVAVQRAVAQMLPAGAQARLKWPNDLLINGAKVAGLLLEGLGNGHAVAIGMGVNVVAHPPGTPYPATHLAAHAPQATAQVLFGHLAQALGDELDAFGNGAGFPLVRARWKASAAHLGHMISVTSDQKICTGRFVDLDDHGRLVIETPGGTCLIAAGDVFPLDK
jgi:BirA family transcriptional regulator, biotin operon repressor / biotin---[acetyl-CoA-carboxylase] ligase